MKTSLGFPTEQQFKEWLIKQDDKTIYSFERLNACNCPIAVFLKTHWQWQGHLTAWVNETILFDPNVEIDNEIHLETPQWAATFIVNFDVENLLPENLKVWAQS